MVLAAAGMIIALFVPGSPALLAAVILLAASVLHSPLVFPRPVDAAEAKKRSVAENRPIIYWRPGCPYCLRLRLRLLGRSRRFFWVDIWRDAQGAEAVRAVADGNETVPTLAFRDQAWVNPESRWVLDQTWT